MQKKIIMNPKVVLGLRVLLGLFMLIFGLNKFANFIPQPEMSGDALDVMMGFVKSGYIMPIVAIVEIVAGILLLIGRFVPLALVILFPVMLNALLFHLALDPGGAAGAGVAVVLNIILFFAYKDRFAGILKA